VTWCICHVNSQRETYKKKVVRSIFKLFSISLFHFTVTYTRKMQVIQEKQTLVQSGHDLQVKKAIMFTAFIVYLKKINTAPTFSEYKRRERQ
jgi:hypothetical protein